MASKVLLTVLAVACLFLSYRVLRLETEVHLIRPGFPRHLKAMENGRFGGAYEQQAIHG